MQNGGNFLGPAVEIYEECANHCRNFVAVLFYHCSREANIAADTLVSVSEGPMSIVWQEKPLSFFVSI
jgi:hypothetical protein